MSTCPKCQKKLRIIDISQNCPHCGVNMRFYDFDKRFIYEAKQAELSMANVHVKLRKFKAALIGSKIAIARLATAVLPVAAMLVPVCNFSLNLPFASQQTGVSALGIYTIFSNGTLNFILEMMSAAVDGPEYAALMAVIGVYAVAALCAVITLLFSLLNFISPKKMAKIICGVNVLGVIAGVVSTVLSVRLPDGASVVTGGPSFGAAAIAAAFAVTFALNYIISRKGLPIEFEEGDLERYEIRKKVLKGEIKLEDLPQPIVETEATRKIDEQIREEKLRYEAQTKQEVH